jgi:hypothetical protein
MAEQKKLSIEEKQAQLLDAQLETQLLTLDRTRKENAVYVDTEEDRRRKREQAQLKAKQDIAAQAEREKACKHMAGVQASNVMGRGVGGSCLSASRIFFAWNWLIQCVWCGMKNQTPHPSRKSRAPKEVKMNGQKRLETAEEVKARIAQYEADLEVHNKLLEDARGTGLPPMVGPAWDFQDADGNPVIPVPR